MTRRVRGAIVMLAAVLLTPPAAAAQSPTPSVSSADRSPAEQWHVLPLGLLYDPYLAGEKEPRASWSVLREQQRGWLWEMSIGLRVGLIRHGTSAVVDADGWQVDFEGAAQPRLDPEDNALESVDYRGGLWLTRRRGPLALKFGYYHLSSHLGDEFFLDHPGVQRVDYVRDTLVAGAIRNVTPTVQAYAEAGYAFVRHGGAKPLEVQAGAQYAGARYTGTRGAPMAAVNVHVRQELHFRGTLNTVLAWGWHSRQTGHRFRAGLQASTGRSLQYSNFNRTERFVGVGLWFDY